MTYVKNKKSWYKKWWIWLIIGVSVLVIVPVLRAVMFPEYVMMDRYRDFPHVAIITISNIYTEKGWNLNTISNIDSEKEWGAAYTLINARTDWVHNQKSDWERNERRRYYTLDLSKNDRLTVIFGYEDDFDINTFADNIASAADLKFVDSNKRQIIDANEIISAHSVYRANTRDVIIKMTESGMEHYLDTVGTKDERTPMQIDFTGAITSDVFTAEVYDGESIIIKGFINSGAAESLVKLIEIKDAPKNLSIDLRTY